MMTPEEQAQGFSNYLNLSMYSVFPDLEAEHLAWLSEQVKPYVDGIKRWQYKLTLEAIYVGFLVKFPSRRDKRESEPHHRAQHISFISEHLHTVAMQGAFQAAGIFDIMRAINPRYPEDVRLDIQITAAELEGARNKFNAAAALHSDRFHLQQRKIPSSFNESITKATFASFHPPPKLYSVYTDMSSDAELWDGPTTNAELWGIISHNEASRSRSRNFPPPPPVSLLSSSSSLVSSISSKSSPFSSRCSSLPDPSSEALRQPLASRSSKASSPPVASSSSSKRPLSPSFMPTSSPKASSSRQFASSSCNVGLSGFSLCTVISGGFSSSATISIPPRRPLRTAPLRTARTNESDSSDSLLYLNHRDRAFQASLDREDSGDMID
ncbi:hypothetical protein C8J56DRAFT_1058427 [Mycena floridula]|nr:hypothetical protein C8J56DRAFT_1058427 [Mycena floridula]